MNNNNKESQYYPDSSTQLAAGTGAEGKWASCQYTNENVMNELLLDNITILHV